MLYTVAKALTTQQPNC